MVEVVLVATFIVAEAVVRDVVAVGWLIRSVSQTVEGRRWMGRREM